MHFNICNKRYTKDNGEKIYTIVKRVNSVDEFETENKITKANTFFT